MWDFTKPHRPATDGTRHAVSSCHYLATQVGFSILEAGGNAIDAGVAAGITLNVVEGQMCSFSGVAPMMIYIAAEDRLVTVDGLGTWPRAATCEFFRDRGYSVMPTGILQSVVPGAPDAWITALERWGTMRFSDIAREAIRFARDGYPLQAHQSLTLGHKRDDFPVGTEAARVFLPNGRPPYPGESFVQPDLARVLQYLADEDRAAGPSRQAGLNAVRQAFYCGDIARTIVQHQRDNDGLLSAEDLAGYRVSVDSPVSSTFQSVDVYTCGFWCQGPLLLQQLNILEEIDLKAMRHNSPDYVHALVEAIKLSAADREAWYGDPKFVDVPVETLLSKEYAAGRRSLINPDTAWKDVPPAGTIDGYSGYETALISSPESALASLPLDTSYVCVVDQKGNAFSATPSDGCVSVSPIVPGLGFAVSPRGMQSRLDPNHPSCVEPGKRPRLTPNPAMARRYGDFMMPFGTPGGDLQTQAMLQAFLNMTVFTMSPQEAVEAPRFYSYSFPDSFSPHSYFPGKLRLEFPISARTADDLNARGHKVDWWPADLWPKTSVCAIKAEMTTGMLRAAVDHRKTGSAIAS